MTTNFLSKIVSLFLCTSSSQTQISGPPQTCPEPFWLHISVYTSTSSNALSLNPSNSPRSRHANSSKKPSLISLLPSSTSLVTFITFREVSRVQDLGAQLWRWTAGFEPALLTLTCVNLDKLLTFWESQLMFAFLKNEIATGCER